MSSASSASTEARILDGSSNVLIARSGSGAVGWGERAFEGFFGAVIRLDDVRAPGRELPSLSGKTVYLVGDLSELGQVDLSAAARVVEVRDDDLGRLPILVHGVGVYYRRFFDPAAGTFERVQREHQLQSLTESTKPEKAHRTGIYLTPVERRGDALHFRLLRCSTNLSGPTDNFRATDRHIVDALNQEARFVFEGAAPLNHVLAQIYRNTPADLATKQAKARISAHADKTKDMPASGVMAFCTFYDRVDGLRPLPQDPFDRGQGATSALTRLRFRWKGEDPGTFPAEFSVTLYPDSAFFMPLSTNRLYTHEIQPSALDAARLPTRLGYVVRCSNAEAIHREGQTFLATAEGDVPLEPATQEGMAALRQLYAEENRTQSIIDYGAHLRFSINEGDYQAPIWRASDAFRAYSLRAGDDLFAELSASVHFEDVAKGRRGAVLLVPDERRGAPIVRTTTPYTHPAQRLSPVQQRLARQIRACASLASDFNNALIELYTSASTSMGAHSDQALDLEEGSEIAIFSCYARPRPASSGTAPRRLQVESKEPGGPSFEIPLLDRGVVVFSTETNRRFRHRIVLDASSDDRDNEWLGITFRRSWTFVGADARLADGATLTLATEDERRAFYQLRRLENQETDFRYPRITYTLSPSDLRPPAEAPIVRRS